MGIKWKKQRMITAKNDIITDFRFKMNHIVHSEHPYETTNFWFSLLMLPL